MTEFFIGDNPLSSGAIISTIIAEIPNNPSPEQVTIPYQAGQSFPRVRALGSKKTAGSVTIPYQAGQSFPQEAVLEKIDALVKVTIPYQAGQSFPQNKTTETS